MIDNDLSNNKQNITNIFITIIALSMLIIVLIISGFIYRYYKLKVIANNNENAINDNNYNYNDMINEIKHKSRTDHKNDVINTLMNDKIELKQIKTNKNTKNGEIDTGLEGQKSVIKINLNELQYENEDENDSLSDEMYNNIEQTTKGNDNENDETNQEIDQLCNNDGKNVINENIFQTHTIIPIAVNKKQSIHKTNSLISEDPLKSIQNNDNNNTINIDNDIEDTHNYKSSKIEGDMLNKLASLPSIDKSISKSYSKSTPF